MELSIVIMGSEESKIILVLFYSLNFLEFRKDCLDY